MSTVLDKNKIIKQGWLQKKSKHLGSWRPRLTIVTDKYLYTFKNENTNTKPTEKIRLSIITISSFSDLIFQIRGDCNYLFKVEKKSDRIEWMNCINKYARYCIEVNINVECTKNNKYNDHFELSLPYDNAPIYSIGMLMTDVMCYINKKYTPLIFFAVRIRADSFVCREMLYDDAEWIDNSVSITQYNKHVIKQNGIHLQIQKGIPVKVPIVIECYREHDFNDNFELIIAYDENCLYSINTLITEIMDCVNINNNPFQFVAMKIKSDSFVDDEINCNDNDWINSVGIKNITEYDKSSVKQKGIHLIIKGDDIYLLKAAEEKSSDIMGKYKHCIKMPIIVECPRDVTFNDRFYLLIPYHNDYPYCINMLVTDIIDYVNNKYDQFRFFATKIKTDSFLGQNIHYNDYDWTDQSPNITEYAKIVVVQVGMHLEIDMEIYKHNTSSFNSICTNMKDINQLCPIYAKMRYQDIFTEEDLIHLYDYMHPYNIECKYGDECYAFQRAEKGGNELNDRAHVAIYKHPPRRFGGINSGEEKIEMNEEINSFCLNEEFVENVPLYYPTDEDKKECNYNKENGFLQLLIKEVIDNGFKSDLCINDEDEKNDNYTIMNIVEQKLKCMRHKKMGSPLNRAEMLSLLLYTGGDCNYDLCKTQRDEDYIKWNWFDYCLHNAINKLSKREHGSYKIYTGLGSTRLKTKLVKCGYFKTFVSTSWVKYIALTFVDDQGMLFEIDKTFREKAICCDVSWISKFGQSECEILIARSIDSVFNRFEC
eukprot:510231_1